MHHGAGVVPRRPAVVGGNILVGWDARGPFNLTAKGKDVPGTLAVNMFGGNPIQALGPAPRPPLLQRHLLAAPPGHGAWLRFLR
jgi:hypothetical protein